MDTLLPGEKLLPGEALRSRNGKVELLLQEDGNLVLHRTHNNTPLWSTNTAGLPIRDCAMQQDGNFVMYDKQGRTVFTTNTYGKHGATLKVRDDGNLCLYQAGQCHWSTNTNPGPPRVPRFPRPQAQPKTAGIRF